MYPLQSYPRPSLARLVFPATPVAFPGALSYIHAGEACVFSPPLTQQWDNIVLEFCCCFPNFFLKSSSETYYFVFIHILIHSPINYILYPAYKPHSIGFEHGLWSESEFKSWLCHLLAGGPWASCFCSLCISLLMYKIWDGSITYSMGLL